MTDSIEYQTPLANGRNLRSHELPDGIRISRDAVSRGALWREVIMPAISIVGLPLAAAYAVWWSWHFRNFASPGQIAIPLVIAAVALVHLARVIRDSWQNAGIVTEVAVTNGTFYWRKQTLWGTSEHFWPLASVKLVKVDPLNRMLKVTRTRGKALGAFAFHPIEEMNAAAAELNAAIEKNRTASVAQPVV
jgi:hypothetical protein